MFELLNPQPIRESDVSNWKRGIIKEHGKEHGLGVVTDYGLFIPFPGEDMAGVKIVQHNAWWYWARPEFFNTSNPLETIRNELKDLNVFYEPQLSIIAGAVNYVANTPSASGSDHHLQMVIAILYELLSLSLHHLTDSQALAVLGKFAEWEISNI